MNQPSMTADHLAAELGRSTDWIYRNWRDLAAKRGLPQPVMGGHGKGSGQLAWSSAQIYAWLDRDLPAHLKAAAAAYRAAATAYRGAAQDPATGSTLSQSRARLDDRFNGAEK